MAQTETQSRDSPRKTQTQQLLHLAQQAVKFDGKQRSLAMPLQPTQSVRTLPEGSDWLQHPNTKASLRSCALL